MELTSVIQPRAYSRVAYLLLGFTLVAALLRLPQLTNAVLMVDGDESIVALMGLHLLQGESFPLFFLGQRYGLSTLEAIAAAGALAVTGPSATSLKLAGLAIWLSGACLVIYAVSRMLGWRGAIIVSVLLASMPAWSIWSMKLRGGYLTAFGLSSLLLVVIAAVRARSHIHPLHAAGVGAILALVFLAQPLWLLATVPFLLLIASKFRASSALVAVTVAAVCVLVVFMGRGDVDAWSPRVFDWSDPVTAVTQLPRNVAIMLSGAHSLSRPLSPGPITKLAAALWLLAVSAAVPLTWAFSKGRGSNGVGVAAALAFLSCTVVAIALWTPGGGFPFRYLLPAAIPAALAVSVVLERLSARGPKGRAIAAAALALLFVTGCGSMIEAARLAASGAPSDELRNGVPEEDAIRALVTHLRKRGIQGVYSDHHLLQWKIALYSEGGLPVRWRESHDRYPQFAHEVDRVSSATGQTALVGYRSRWAEITGEFSVAGAYSPAFVEDWFFVLERPSRELLKLLGYELAIARSTE